MGQPISERTYELSELSFKAYRGHLESGYEMALAYLIKVGNNKEEAATACRAVLAEFLDDLAR